LVKEAGKGRRSLGDREGNIVSDRAVRQAYKWPKLIILALYTIYII
jgi:hypothetical protein